MARITVEDCIDKFESRFELILVASNRARKLHFGETSTVEKDNDKPTVIALREIADETISVDSLKNKLIEEYQTISPLDEEEILLDYTDSETDTLGEKFENQSMLNGEVIEENISDEDSSREDADESALTNKNDDYTEMSDANKADN